MRVVVLSRHPSHKSFKNRVKELTTKSNKILLVRLGSSTSTRNLIEERTNLLKKTKTLKGKKLIDYSKYQFVEINSVEGINNSSNKRRMKEAFNRANISHADWFTADDQNTYTNRKNNSKCSINDLPYPMIVKHIYGSRGRGNYKVDNVEQMRELLKGKNLQNYIFEKFYTFNKEYRLHVNENGCFYTCRKMLKKDTPDDKKFQRHDDNCVWIIEENKLFDKPTNFKTIISDCVKALKELNLNFAAFDVKTQSSKDKKGRNRENVEYIIIESNSAPSFGDRTEEEYLKMIKTTYYK